MDVVDKWEKSAKRREEGKEGRKEGDGDIIGG